MTTTQSAPIIPSFDEEDTGRKLAIICSKGNLDMAYPGLILANAALGEGVETAPVLHVLGLRHDQQEDHGRPEVHDARQHRDPHAARAWAACPE